MHVYVDPRPGWVNRKSGARQNRGGAKRSLCQTACVGSGLKEGTKHRMQLPIFHTMGEILDYCWARRQVMAMHGAVPLMIVCTLNLGAWLFGIGGTMFSPGFIAINLANAVVFLPFTVTWYRMIILGDEDLTQRPMFGYTAREGRLFLWQAIIILIVGSAAALGLFAVNAVGGALGGPGGENLEAFLAILLIVAVIAASCRLSLVLAMTATDRPADLAEAWGRTDGLGARMAAISVLSVLIAAALVIPLYIVVILISSLFGAISEDLGNSATTALAIIANSFGSLFMLAFPTTLFAFVYNGIAAQMGAGGTREHPANDAIAYDSESPEADPHPETQPTQDVEDVIDTLLEFIDGKPRETAEDTRVLVDSFFGQFKMPSEVLLDDFDAEGVACRWVVMPEADVDKVVLLFHGGGFSAGSIDSHQRLAADISAVCGMRVLVPDYRLAPEHPYPAGLDDCVTVYRWLLDNGFKPGHIVIAGDSAGGGLTVSTALRLKEEGLDQPACLVAMSPWVNLACDGETMETKAKEDPIGNAETLLRAANDYLQEQDVRDPLVSPIYGDLRGLPPLLIQVGTREVLLDDSRKLAVRARADDVQVTLEEWPGMIHDWQMMTDWLTDGRRALAGIGTFVRHRIG